MNAPKRIRPSGFTAIELLITLGIIAIIGSMAYSSLSLQRPRANLNSTAAELQSLLHGARQSALASGKDVVVMLFADDAATGVRRVIVYEDGEFNLLSGGGFGSYAPLTAATLGPLSDILAVFDFPQGIQLGPQGMGAGTRLPAPLAALPVASRCSFCTLHSGSERRGAIRFFPDGTASFHDDTGAQLAATTPGHSFSVSSADVGGTWTLAVLRGTGKVVSFRGAGN